MLHSNFPNLHEFSKLKHYCEGSSLLESLRGFVAPIG